jgi:hypothetical protein
MAVKLAPGMEIDAWCGKCKEVRQHVIVVLKGTRAGKTQCQTCQSVHAYRKNPPGTLKAAGMTRQETALLRSYEKAMDGRDTSKAIKYKISQKFAEEAIVNHKTFGIGLVTRLVPVDKIEVQFKDGTRLLVHARS